MGLVANQTIAHPARRHQRRDHHKILRNMENPKAQVLLPPEIPPRLVALGKLTRDN